MAKKNAFLKRVEDHIQDFINASWDTAQQFTVDCFMLALNDEFGFGLERAKRLLDVASRYNARFFKAFRNETESDFYQEKLDAALREILGDELVPFVERYPRVKETRYGKQG